MKWKYTQYIYATAVAIVSATACYAAPEDTNTELQQGLRAMQSYDFKSARTHLEKYKSLIRKEKLEPDYRADEALGAIPLAEEMLAGRVEQIVIVDSLCVPKADFFKAYSLSSPTGKYISTTTVQDMGSEWEQMDAVSPIYESEDGTLRYISVHTEYVDEADGTITPIDRIYEAFRLGDGTWSEPRAIFDEDVDASYPYIRSDGATFYFASKSEQGLGGYDIFKSYRDSDTGEFQNPANMGMPYNSPANDYLLVIDEYTGAGWWATDRNIPEGEEMVNIYVFIPSEVRHNYDADTPDIKALAALWPLHFPQEMELVSDDAELPMHGYEPAQAPGWKLTWPEGADYSELLNRLQSVGQEPVEPASEFSFIGKQGHLYTTYDELPMTARAPMQRYQEAVTDLQAAELRLAQLRLSYKKHPVHSAIMAIDEAQKQVDTLRSKVKTMRNNVYKSL